MKWKIRCVINSLRIVPEEACVVVSDLDIVWMPGAFQELNEASKRGIYAMCEDEQARLNAGLIVGRNTPEYRWLFSQCLAYMSSNPGKHDQDALRAVGGCNVGTLPPAFANTKTQRLTPIPKVLCFHAICTMADEKQSSIEKKEEMLRGWLTGVSHTS